MFYYFNPNTLKCEQSATCKLANTGLIMVADYKRYDDLEKLQCTKTDGVWTITEVETNTAELTAAIAAAVAVANAQIAKYAIADASANADSIKLWSDYRTAVQSATTLPLIDYPEEPTNE